MCLKYANRFRRDSQHDWEDLYDNLMSARIFTLIMYKISYEL